MTEAHAEGVNPEAGEATPVNTAEPSEANNDEQVATEQATDQEAPKPEPEDPVKVMEKRISRQTAALRQLNEQRETYEKRIKELEEKLAPANAEPKEPREDDFDTVEAYKQALKAYNEEKVEWLFQQKSAEAQKAQTEERQKAEAQKTLEDARKAFFEKQDAFAKSVPDYDQATGVLNGVLEEIKQTDPHNPVYRAFAQAMLDAENTPAISYHLGKNPGEIEKFYSMTPQQAYRRVVQLDLELSAKRPAPPEPKPQPAPPTPVKGTGKPRKSLDDMSPKELRKWAEA